MVAMASPVTSTRHKLILEAAADLFYERSFAGVGIDAIGERAGMTGPAIYRHFSGKDEILALALVGYLEELAAALDAAAAGYEEPSDRLAAIIEAFVDYGIAYPAFVDCAQELMRRSGPALLDELTESALLRLGRGIASCLSILTATLDAGQRTGEFVDTDSVVLANHMYASGLGALQLARLGMLIRESRSGVPAMVPLPADQVKKYLVVSARALATK